MELIKEEYIQWLVIKNIYQKMENILWEINNKKRNWNFTAKRIAKNSRM